MPVALRRDWQRHHRNSRIEHRAGSDTVMFSMSDENLMRWARYYRFEAMG